MNLSKDAILILVLIVVLSAALLGFVLYVVFLRHRIEQRAVLREILEQFAGMNILASSANAFFNGLNRSWDRQWRGYGVLVLTDGMLYFRLSRRKLDLSIPLERIENADIILHHNKRPATRQFQVRYRGTDDQLRIASWIVRRPHKWVHNLETTLEGIRHDGKA